MRLPRMTTRHLMVVMVMAAGTLVGPPGARLQASDEANPSFEVRARLHFPDDRETARFQAMRSVVLHLPHVYVLDRSGRLAIYRVEGPARPEEIPPTRILQDFGDGNELKLVGDVLLCTRSGQLDVYSLHDPGQPRHLARIGPAKKDRFSLSLVIHEKFGFVLAKDGILAYDLSSPAEPRYLGMTENATRGPIRAGCAVGRHLYVGGRFEAGVGITIYDLSDPSQLKNVGFMATTRDPYNLFALPGRRLLASEDADTLIHFGTGIHGRAAIFSLEDPTKPNRVSERDQAGGRAAALMTFEGRSFLICNGGVLAIKEKGLTDVFSYASGGSTLDGLPYHGDSEGGFAALALDRAVIVIVIGPRPMPVLQAFVVIIRVSKLLLAR